MNKKEYRLTKKMNRSSVTLQGYNKRSMMHVTRVLKGEQKESVAEQQLEKNNNLKIA